MPIVVIGIVALIFVPGPTVPKDTPKALIWKRKLWELHVGWLGLALALVSAWFFTEGMKNMFGKPRPDMLSRCEPDIENAAKYIVGGYTGQGSLGRLYSADICQQTDSHKLDDGFRSYPSGHSSSAAAGLIYTSLFLASKFAVTIPFVVPGNAPRGAATHAAFPSRLRPRVDSYEPSRGLNALDDPYTATSPLASKVSALNAQQNERMQSLRRQAAAPPIYLLVITIMPFCCAVFVASSRWFDFRHHGFDILFGFLMGVATSIYSFRYYHMPIQQGAGWAWGPRSDERAFWAGVGRLGYAGGSENLAEQMPPNDMGESAGAELRPNGQSAGLNQRPARSDYSNESHEYRGAQHDDFVSQEYRPPHHDYEAQRQQQPFQDVELRRIDSRP